MQNESDLPAENERELVCPPHQLIEATWHGELRSGWGQCEWRGRARWDPGRLPSSGAVCAHAYPMFAFPYLVWVHAPRPADWSKFASGKIQRVRQFISAIWPGHRSMCFYQLRPSVQSSAVRISCSSWPNSLLSCEMEPVD